MERGIGLGGGKQGTGRGGGEGGHCGPVVVRERYYGRSVKKGNDMIGSGGEGGGIVKC